MPVKREGVSMKDVAALAGVSIGTVSNVINRPEVVSGDTVDRVERAIAKLGWFRNESARQLRAGRSRMLGVVVMDVANPFFTDVLAGVEDCAHAKGFAVQLGNSALQAERELRHLEMFEGQRVRGVLLTPVQEVGDRISRLRQRHIPVVLVDRSGQGLDCCSVSVDDIDGGRLAVDHLITQGHRRIAVVGGPGTVQQVRDRRLGAELASGNGARAELLVVSTSELDAEAGVAAAGEIATMPDELRPTGVFAVNDLIAIGLLQGFVSHGLRVGEDVALIGYDDITFAALAAIPLSSIRQPRHEMGARATTLLLDEIAAADDGTTHVHQHVRFAPELVVRRSTVRSTERVSQSR